jgi:hypothetical protein
LLSVRSQVAAHWRFLLLSRRNLTLVQDRNAYNLARKQWIHLLICEEANVAVWVIAIVVPAGDYASDKVREKTIQHHMQGRT